MTPHGLRRPLHARLLDSYPLSHAGLRLLLEPFSARVRLVGPGSEVDVVLYEPTRLSSEERARLRELGTNPLCVQIAYSWDELQPHSPFISKAAPATQLVGRIEELVRQRRRADPDAEHAGPMPVRLSPRERQVLALVGDGLTNIEIGLRLELSINSVKTYLRSAYRKTGVNRRSQAVSWCMQHGVSGREVPLDPAAARSQAAGEVHLDAVDVELEADLDEASLDLAEDVAGA